MATSQGNGYGTQSIGSRLYDDLYVIVVLVFAIAMEGHLNTISKLLVIFAYRAGTILDLCFSK